MTRSAEPGRLDAEVDAAGLLGQALARAGERNEVLTRRRLRAWHQDGADGFHQASPRGWNQRKRPYSVSLVRLDTKIRPCSTWIVASGGPMRRCGTSSAATWTAPVNPGTASTDGRPAGSIWSPAGLATGRRGCCRRWRVTQTHAGAVDRHPAQDIGRDAHRARGRYAAWSVSCSRKRHAGGI